MSANYLRDKISFQLGDQGFIRGFNQIDDHISAQIRAQISDQISDRGFTQILDQIDAGELALNPQLLAEARVQMVL